MVATADRGTIGDRRNVGRSHGDTEGRLNDVTKLVSDGVLPATVTVRDRTGARARSREPGRNVEEGTHRRRARCIGFRCRCATVVAVLRATLSGKRSDAGSSLETQ